MPAAPGRRLVVETDGGARGNPGPGGYGAVVRDAESGEVLAERAAFLGVVSNNVAEYSGLVHGLRAAAEIDTAAVVEVRADSKLVVEQMSGRWKIKHAELAALAEQARQALPPGQVRYTWVPRAQNTAADALANAVMDSGGTIARDHTEDRVPSSAVSGPGRAGRADGQQAGWSGAHDDAEEAAAAEANAPRSSGTPLPRHDGEPVTVVLVRHGVTAHTESGRYSGGDTPGPPLSELGRRQVRGAAAIVRRVGTDLWPDLPTPSQLVASPMVRTRETAAALGEPLGLTAGTEARLAECRFGSWDTLTVPEIEAGWPGQLLSWATDPDHRPPGGESMADVGVRVGAVVRRLAADRRGSTVVVAAHTVVIRAAVGLVGQLPAAHWSSVRIPPASVTIVRVWPQAGADGHLVGDLTVVACPAELGA
ncbi:bifunctional RNase H/acid phosphatase [Georgenia subflava]|uniref:Bifunctional RNase H/acid phosphatase n=1 Tax=Georgenia subflava TaxID=1622177 RepID=A0A6N7EQJ2_9MICO|nr:bifunctional RNase H/acid phosphatase [Georgenia subflava]